jgi:hypothetical protein
MHQSRRVGTRITAPTGGGPPGVSDRHSGGHHRERSRISHVRGPLPPRQLPRTSVSVQPGPPGYRLKLGAAPLASRCPWHGTAPLRKQRNIRREFPAKYQRKQKGAAPKGSGDRSQRKQPNSAKRTTDSESKLAEEGRVPLRSLACNDRRHLEETDENEPMRTSRPFPT